MYYNENGYDHRFQKVLCFCCQTPAISLRKKNTLHRTNKSKLEVVIPNKTQAESNKNLVTND